MPAVPAYPLVGSMPALSSLERRHPPLKVANELDQLLLLLYKEKGEIYSMGLPGLGSGVRGMTVCTSNPEEFHKVIRTEGEHPYGVIQDQWPTVLALKSMDSKVMGFFGQGADWRRFRKVVQKGMMPPLTAKGYLASISKACEMASPGAAAHGPNIADFTMRCSFDIFCSIMFGQFTGTADPHRPTDPRHERFCRHVMDANEHIIPMLSSPYEYMSNMVLGVPTRRARAVLSNFRAQLGYSNEFVSTFVSKWEAGRLDGFEASSYMAVSLGREAEMELSREELMELNQLLLTAAVDTTSAVLTWAILQLAINPRAQATLADELAASLGGGPITEAMTGRAFLPYLHAVVRECHRMRPVLPISLFKRTAQPLELCGYAVPEGMPVLLDSFSPQNDPLLVSDPGEFQPERWLPDAVQARQGTPAEVIDHPFMRGPFSAGARMCPGSRVAQLEVLAMLARLVQDWEFEVADPGVRSIADVPYYRGLTVMPTKPAPAVVFQPRARP